MKLVRGFALVVLTGIVIGLAACSGDDDDGAAAPPPTTTKAPATEPAPTGETAEEAAPGGDGPTPSQERAVRLAQNSLDLGGFSRLGLINYLTQVEGFTRADARYAADNARANWKEQAVEAAQRRVDSTDGYSPTNLIRNLTQVDGFTKADATYAAFHVDVDWRLEAWQAAASWLRNREGLTESELLERLESDGFSAVDAQYGVDKVRDDERTRDGLEGDL